MKKHARTLIVLLAAVALVASVASLYVHYRLLADPTYTSFCDVSETVSCEAVMTSRFGYVFGIPVAAGGAIWSALVLILAPSACVLRRIADSAPGRRCGKRARRNRAALRTTTNDSDRARRCRLHLHLVDARSCRGAVSWLRVLFVLRQMCPLCLTMYVAVIGLFIVSGGAASDLSGLPARLG